MQPVDPFPAADFNDWADSYDEDVITHGRFPFAGYGEVLDYINQQASPQMAMSVLDIGIGTGNLASGFARLGCRVWGSDFSAAMLAKARQKLPEAELVLHDLRDPWPSALNRLFDRVVSAYTFHHFELSQKVELAGALAREHLEPGGRLLIGDISFPSEARMREFAEANSDLWDAEPYWLADEAVQAMSRAGLRTEYRQVSACAGVYQIEPG